MRLKEGLHDRIRLPNDKWDDVRRILTSSHDVGVDGMRTFHAKIKLSSQLGLDLLGMSKTA